MVNSGDTLLTLLKDIKPKIKNKMDQQTIDKMRQGEYDELQPQYQHQIKSDIEHAYINSDI